MVVDRQRKLERLSVAALILVAALGGASILGWIPTTIVDALFAIILIAAPVLLNILGWRNWRRERGLTEGANWRSKATRLGLLANSLVIAVFWEQALIGYFTWNWPALGQTLIDWSFLRTSALLLSLISLVAGIVGLGRARVPLLLSSLFIGFLWGISGTAIL